MLSPFASGASRAFCLDSSPRWPQEGPKMATRDPKMAPKRPQDGSKEAPRWLQRGPKMAQDGPKMAPAQTWEQFWFHFGSILGPLLVPKSIQNRSSILGRFLMPFWDQFWSHFGIKIGPIWVSCRICAESPATTSPHSKTIEKTIVV